MQSFTRRILGQKTTNKSLPYPAATQVRQQENAPIHFMDCGNKGLYITVTHVTSSGYTESIKREGLRPLQNLRVAVRDYLQSIAPNHALEIGRILEFNEQSDRADGLALLISNRFAHEPNPRCVYANLLLGGRGYLESAGANALGDGGEIFKAARMLIAQRLEIDLKPRFTDDHLIVALIKLRLIISENGFAVQDVPNHKIVINEPLDVASLGGAGEIRIVGNIPPSEIKIVDGDRFLEREIYPVSPAARETLTRLRLS